jgi:hypothetical protein
MKIVARKVSGLWAKEKKTSKEGETKKAKGEESASVVVTATPEQQHKGKSPHLVAEESRPSSSTNLHRRATTIGFPENSNRRSSSPLDYLRAQTIDNEINRRYSSFTPRQLSTLPQSSTYSISEEDWRRHHRAHSIGMRRPLIWLENVRAILWAGNEICVFSDICDLQSGISPSNRLHTIPTFQHRRLASPRGRRPTTRRILLCHPHVHFVVIAFCGRKI